MVYALALSRAGATLEPTVYASIDRPRHDRAAGAVSVNAKASSDIAIVRHTRTHRVALKP